MRWRGWFLAAMFVLLCGCGHDDRQGRVIVLGIDGLDPYAIDLLISEGELPNFARMRSDGAYGKLTAAPPLLSPVLWTTIATGKAPTEHGIGHFTTVDRATETELPVTSSMRRVKALWNIASDAGQDVATVGWWATWPPEAIRGVVVSDHTCYHFLGQKDGLGEAAGAIYPGEMAPDLVPLVRRPVSIGFEELGRFIDVDPIALDRPIDFSNEVSQLRWALASAGSYSDIGLKLWSDLDPELLMVYIEATDSVSHLFGHLFRAEGLAGELAVQQKRYGRAVEEVYRLADEIVGRFMDVMDDDTTLVVLSDHGFKLGDLHDDPTVTRDLRRVSERFHRQKGILYLLGAGVRRNGRIDSADQLDVTPTVLALLGLNPALDMPGRVLDEALDFEPAVRTLASYEDAEPLGLPVASDSAVDAEIVARLRGLGYLADGNESPTSDRNLAAMEFERGRFEEAASIYARLVKDDPNNAGLLTSLAGCLGALGRYDDALIALDRALVLEPVNAEGFHNRAVIHERRGDPAAAITDYRQALRYAPKYEPSRLALLRLTGSSEVWHPENDAEEQAAKLAEQAAELARHGAYAEAMELLDKAALAAPSAVVVYQYRANVAFLMGDYARAEVALLRALELEPSNALFARNLDGVRARRAAAGE